MPTSYSAYASFAVVNAPISKLPHQAVCHALTKVKVVHDAGRRG
jgi:hypothetical protein